MAALRRGLPLWLVLVAVYALTLAVDAAPGRHLSGAEAHRLLTAESLVSDRDVDLRDEYATHAWRAFSDRPLHPAAAPTDGRLVEPSAWASRC